MELIPLAPVSIGAVPWRGEGARASLTVIVKTTYLLDSSFAALTDPLPLFSDVYFESNEGRSLYVASDHSIRKAQADVLFSGYAYAPHGAPVPTMNARLSLEGADGVLFDKTVLVMGERRRNPLTGGLTRPSPFTRMPIRWELAFGGSRSRLNPIGVGTDTTDGRLPSLVHPDDPRENMGFGAISPSWWLRARALHGVDPRTLEGGAPLVDPRIDPSFFNAAPLDQRVRALHGDEIVRLSGLHPQRREVQSQLPGLRAHALLDIAGSRPLVVPLVADTLWIEGDSLRACVVHRGDLPIDDLSMLSRARVLATLSASNQAPSWGPALQSSPPSGGPMKLPTLTPRAWKSTQTDPTATPIAPPDAPRRPITRTQRIAVPEGVSSEGARPSSPPSEPAAVAAPRAPSSPSQRVAVAPPAIVTPAPPSPSPMPIAPPMVAPKLVEAPFIPRIPLPIAPPPIAARAPTSPSGLAPRANRFITFPKIADEDLPTAEERDDRELEPAPPIVEAPPPSQVVRGAVIPARTVERLPLLNASPFPAFSFPFQLKPPQDARVVVIKATFTLDDDGPPKLAEEQEPPMGDLPWAPEDRGGDAVDDAPTSLRYASDFAPFKPKADVLLVGDAYSGGEGNVGVVTLRLGALERRLAVFGDRQWSAIGPSSPLPFERIPLRYERAMGGPLSEANPVGVGFKTSVLAPNLEHPERLLTSSSDEEPPACTAPVSPWWRPRSSKLGSYGGKWLKTRWPWFPEDFDWAFFNAAPIEQQTDYLEGNEPFELLGVSPGGKALRGVLPSVRPRAYVQETAEAGGNFYEIALRLDTVWFDAAARVLVLVWRGMFDASAEDAPEAAAIFVEPSTLADVAKVANVANVDALASARARFVAHLAARQIVESEIASDDAVNDVRARAGTLPAHLKAIAAIDEAAGPPSAVAADLPEKRAPKLSRDAVMARLADGASLRGVDFTGCDLAGLDLRGRDLEGAILAFASLRATRLEGAKLRGATLSGADAREIDLVDADLRDADLTSAILEHADLNGATLDGASFIGARCEGASFRKATGDLVSFLESMCDGARFDDAVLPAAEFSGSSFAHANFTRADLSRARFVEASGPRVVMDGATLEDALFEDARAPRGSFRGVVAPRSMWEAAELSDASFERATLTEAGFVRATLDRANLNKAMLLQARFRKASLRATTLLKANAMQASFEGADLRQADFRGANLYQADTWKARLDAIVLDLANVTGTTLEGR